MSGTAPDLDFLEKAFEIANLQADTNFKQAQTRYEAWKVVISAMTAGGAMAGGLLALFKLVGW